MKYWNNRLKIADEYIPGEQPQNLDEFTKLNTNENPFPPSRAVLDAIQKAANESLRFYPDPAASGVRRPYADLKGVEEDNVFIGNGSDEIFSLIFRGFIEPDGRAAFPYPSYSLYDTLAQLNGIAYEKINLSKDFTYDLKGFLKKKYNLVIIANPNNPTGTYCPVVDIRAFLKKYRGLLVVDEAYIDFYGGSSVELVREFNNIIVTQSFSKSYSLAGLRIGVAVACSDIIRGFMKLKDSYNVDRIAAAAAAAALKDAKGFKYNIEMVVSNKEYLEEKLGEMGFSIVPSRANFIFVRHPDISADKLYEDLKDRKILVRYFSGPRQSDYVRISVGTMMEIKKLTKELASLLNFQPPLD